MLGQLLHSIHPRRTPSRQPTYLESVTEDAHTRGLLFPDASTLQHFDGQSIPLTFDSAPPQSPGPGYDGIQGEIDLEHSRDIRIIVAQDEAGHIPRSVLFDSKQSRGRRDSASKTFAGRSGRPFAGPNSPATPIPPSAAGHARRSSMVSDATSPRAPAAGAFQRARSRASSISSMPNIDLLTTGRRQTEPDATIQSTCLDCMFGNVAMGYKGTGHKLHIIPLEPRAIDQSIGTFASEGQGSLPRGDGRKRSNLAKSYTPTNPPPDLSSPPLASDGASKERRRTVLISRIFSVTLPEEPDVGDDASVRTPTPQGSMPRANAFPFPQVANHGTSTPGGGMRRSKPNKLPMYGVSIVVQLPVAPPRPSRPDGHHVGSFPGHESLCSSVDSDRRGGWSWIDSSSGVDSLLSASYSSDVDDRVDTLGQHWDVIIRTLTSLQFVVQERVLAHFKAADAGAVQLLQAQKVPRPFTRDQMNLLPSRRSPKLPPYAFAEDIHIQRAVNKAGERVVRGMKIPRVTTGQNRWGVWREEARWLGRWAGGKEGNFFFFTLLTAFLGHHTEWLNVLGPMKHKQLHREKQRSGAGEDLTISNRTIITTTDKMAARRLLFLLSTFLPGSAHAQLNEEASPVRPGTSASARGYSQSPPHNVIPSRQQSLRRTINRRGRLGPHHMRTLTGNRSLTQQSMESTADKTEPTAFDADDFRGHSRRPSEARSTHSGLGFPTLAESASAGKSSATTTSTVVPDGPLPVPHFATRRTASIGPTDTRPESSESLASTNLMHTLERSSTHISNPSTGTQSTGRWSSLISFWSGGRSQSSTDQSEILQSTDEGLGLTTPGYRRPIDSSSPNKLERMVRELDLENQAYQDESAANESAFEDGVDEDSAMSSGIPSSGARDIPRRPKSIHEPLKLSVNEDDGVIDVDIPLPGFGGSPIRSPMIPGFHHSSSFGESSLVQSSTGSFNQGENVPPINVAGWLGKFHADFELQGVNPYPELEMDIRRAMSAEPTPIAAATTTTPNLESGPTEKWVEVCSALIADASAFTVKRLRLRRLVRLIPIPSQPAITPGPFAVPAPRVPFIDPYHAGQLAPAMPMSELHLEEKFIEEPVMDIDATLADAIERILAQSAQPSCVHSEASSRSSSQRGRADGRSATEVPAPPVLEIPHGECKLLVLGALEQVVKSVREECDSKSGTKVERPSQAAESTLREGIKRWLVEVE